MAKIMRIYQLEDGYCYNFDTLLLWDFALRFINPKSTLLDIGSGSAILSLLSHRDKKCSGQCVEIDLLMSKISEKNIQLEKADFIVSNVDFKDYKTSVKFDNVISNPPFYTSGMLNGKNARKNLARNSINLPLPAFLTNVKKCIKPNGNLIFCYDARLMDAVFYHLLDIGFNPTTIQLIHPTNKKPASLIIIQAQINSKSTLKILPPIFTHKPNPKNSVDYTRSAKDILKKINTFSIKIKSENVLL